MKKMLSIVLVLLSCAGLPASAAVLNGGFFTAETPDGWELKPEESSETAGVIVSPDKTIVFSVAKIPAPSTTLEAMAAQFATLHGSEDLVKMEGESDGEAWEYTGRVSGKPLYAQLFTLERGAFGCISIIGDYENDVATEIFNGIEFK